jgi:hypothetical protein
MSYDEWPEYEQDIYNRLVDYEDFIRDDERLQNLFDAGLFPEGYKEHHSMSEDEIMARDEAYAELADYLFDQYGIDFDEAFDWEGWRDAYDLAG